MTSDLALSGKVILVTGSSRGIGKAIAKTLHRDGAQVIVHYGSNRDFALALQQELGSRCEIIGADLGQKSETRALWEQALKIHGRIDVLVNNVGVYISSLVTDDTDWDKGWIDNLQINLIAAADLCRFAIQHFTTRDGGIIINMASRSSHRGDNAEHLAMALQKADFWP